MGSVVVRRPEDRFRTRLGWLDSWHSFSFGPHHDPEQTGHGLLIVNNDDVVAPGGGFGTHGHADMEIVTWVLSGALAHRDSTGTDGIIRPGEAQRMSAGRGIRHSEMNASATDPVHFLQMWVHPDTAGVEPSYEQRDVSAALGAGGWVAVASGQGHEGAVSIHQRDAVLWAARLGPDEALAVPDGPHVHLFVARGAADLGGADLGGADLGAPERVALAAGSAVRLTHAGSPSVTAGPEGAEVLVWVTA